VVLNQKKHQFQSQHLLQGPKTSNFAFLVFIIYFSAPKRGPRVWDDTITKEESKALDHIKDEGEVKEELFQGEEIDLDKWNQEDEESDEEEEEIVKKEEPTAKSGRFMSFFQTLTGNKVIIQFNFIFVNFLYKNEGIR
jgi:hypothetical protein